MGLFDFFKKKEENTPKPEEQQEGVLEIEGLELEQPAEEDGEVVLVLEEGAGETAAISHAVHEMMGEDNIEIHRATPDVLYQEDATGAEEIRAEETAELEEITPEEPEETAEAEEMTAEEPEGPEPVRPDEPEDREKAEPDPEPKKGFFARLKEGLDKTRRNIMDGVDSVLGSFTKIDEDLFEELEEALIMADLGVQTTMEIVNRLRNRVKKEHATDPSLVKGMLIEEITEMLSEGAEEEENLPAPTVMLVIGVNGVGKTTTIGKLAHSFKKDGKAVLLAAADTFRAAAIDQLEIWGERAGIEVIKHEENSDPAAVVFDAVHAARNKKADLLICDTAGRLHNKKNLMEELRKIARVIEREYPDANREVYLVLDATTGQNALQQARLFQEVADITGIILTKLDGTAKGGIVVAIKSELKIPVRYIGVGEGIDDLQKFNAADFAKALFGGE
ncbi:MAG: signal recognition particle-docking protein FtsY [Anaerotignum sp.]|jgi:fused signal recognition particle receptor|nr:signal recognition particle-docking protein FtsY [Anaerotignum sp.]